MKLLIALILCVIVLTPAPLVAKAPTVKITITSGDQSPTIDIVELAVRDFHVWEGPGVHINGVPQNTGFIADWAKGEVAKPADGLRRYQIAFYTGCKRSEADSCTVEEPRLSYVVLYAYDPARQHGYVYLPGPGEPWYEVNTRSILRSVEGKWFPTSREWQGFVTRFVTGPR